MPITSQITPSARFTAVRGSGCHLYDASGRAYLDCTSGIGVTSTGHCHPQVVAAVVAQASTLVHAQCATVRHPGLEVLADRLTQITPDGINTFFITTTGTEAVEASIKLARHATGRTEIVAFRGGFHGRTAGSLACTTSKPAYRAGTGPLMGGVHIAEYPYARRLGLRQDEVAAHSLAVLDSMLTTEVAPDEVAAFLVEPVLGEGGYVPADPAFLAGLRSRADAYGILLIVDEVQTGFGRTGTMFTCDRYGLTPDILVMAKGMASGYPLAAIGAAGSLMAKARPGSQGGTYAGNAVAVAASLATLDVFAAENLVNNAEIKGAILTANLIGLQSRHAGLVAEVRGLGLMIGVELTVDAAGTRRILDACEDAGLLLLACGPAGNVVRWVPPLTITAGELAGAVAVFDAALGTL